MSVNRDAIANAKNVTVESIKCENCKYYMRRNRISIIGCSCWNTKDNSKNDFCSFWAKIDKE